jgi:hypothetical protein
MNRWIAVALVATCLPVAAQAATYAFDALPGCTHAANCQAGEAQLRLSVTQSAAESTLNQVRFTFSNLGPQASAIADVYFDDGTLLGIATITNSQGVQFSQHASPGNLPGGNGIGFQTTAGFSADSDPPVQHNGVNPGETLSILFDLLPTASFAQTIQALSGGTALRVGVHVQGFGNGGAQSFVNDTVAIPVPEASSIAMALAGIGVLASAMRRRRGR